MAQEGQHQSRESDRLSSATATLTPRRVGRLTKTLVLACVGAILLLNLLFPYSTRVRGERLETNGPVPFWRSTLWGDPFKETVVVVPTFLLNSAIIVLGGSLVYLLVALGSLEKKSISKEVAVSAIILLAAGFAVWFLISQRSQRLIVGKWEKATESDLLTVEFGADGRFERNWTAKSNTVERGLRANPSETRWNTVCRYQFLNPMIVEFTWDTGMRTHARVDVKDDTLLMDGEYEFRLSRFKRSVKWGGSSSGSAALAARFSYRPESTASNLAS